MFWFGHPLPLGSFLSEVRVLARAFSCVDLRGKPTCPERSILVDKGAVNVAAGPDLGSLRETDALQRTMPLSEAASIAGTLSC